jgi:hypothetical protein
LGKRGLFEILHLHTGAAAATATAACQKTSSKVSVMVSDLRESKTATVSAGAPATMTSVISNSDFE